MLEMPNGLIRMTKNEEATYREFSGLMSIPKTKAQFTQTLTDIIAAMRQRLADGIPRPGDRLMRAELIEDYLSSPHGADALARLRAWSEAGCPVGEQALREAGLNSPALERLERLERERGSGQVPLLDCGGISQPNPTDPEEPENPDSRCLTRHSLHLQVCTPPWVSIQSALVEAELFDPLPPGQE